MYEPTVRCLPRFLAISFLGVLLASACADSPNSADLADRFSRNSKSFERLLDLYSHSVESTSPEEASQLMKQLRVLNVHRDEDAVFFLCTGNISGIERGYLFVEPDGRDSFPPRSHIADVIDESKLAFPLSAYQSLGNGWYAHATNNDSD